MSSCQLFESAFVNADKSIGGRNRTLMTRVWNPVRNHCAPTWWCYKRKEPPGAGCPAQTAPWGISRWRSHRWAAYSRAQLDPELVVVEGVFTHGSQARRPSHGALPPCLPRVAFAVHDVS